MSGYDPTTFADGTPVDRAGALSSHEDLLAELARRGVIPTPAEEPPDVL